MQRVHSNKSWKKDSSGRFISRGQDEKGANIYKSEEGHNEELTENSFILPSVC
jgi:hypothetical protein